MTKNVLSIHYKVVTKLLRYMNNTAKKEACAALSGKEIFSQEAVAHYLKISNYKTKQTWVVDIQKPEKICHYVTSLENDVSRLRRKSFRLLSRLQVEELLPQVQNKKIGDYAKIQLALHDGSCISERCKLEQRANRLETEIIRLCVLPETCPDKADLRRFLTISVLYGDKHYLYDTQTKEAFRHLCEIVH